MSQSPPSRTVILWIGAILMLGSALSVPIWAMTLARELPATGVPVPAQSAGFWGQLTSVTIDRADAMLVPGAFLSHIAAVLRDSELFAHLNIPLRSLGFTILWLLSVLGIGARASERLLPPERPLLERLVFAFACGFLMLGLATLAVGVLGLARPAPLFALLLASALSSIAPLRTIGREVRARAPRHPLHVRQDPAKALLALFLLAVIGGAFLFALTPPVQSDGLRYHLGAPQEWLKAGRIVYLPWNAFSNFPFLPEMHFLLGLAAGAPESSQLMHFVTALFTAAGISAFVQRFGSRGEAASETAGKRAGVPPELLLAALYLTAPAALIVAGWPFIDHAVALYFLLSSYAVLVALRRSSAGSWCLAGMMAAGALGTKYTALPHVALLCVVAVTGWIVYSPPSLTRSSRFIAPRHLLLAGAVAAVLGGVWFLKNTLFTGNPVYPLAHHLFRGGDWTPASAALYHSKTLEKGEDKTLPNLLASPARATFEWHNYERQFLGSVLLVTSFGFLLGCFSAGSMEQSRGRPFLLAALVALAYYVTWFYSYQSNRMLIPFLALALPVMAPLLYEVRRSAPFVSFLTTAAIILSILYGGLWTLQYLRLPRPPVLEYVLGGLSREEYLLRAVPQVRAFRELEKQLRPGEKVLFIGEHRIFYASFPAVWSDWFDTPAVLGILRESRSRTADDLLKELRRRQVRWIFLNEHELSLGNQLQTYFRPRFSASEWRILQDLLATPELQRKTLPPGFVLLRLNET